MYTTRPVTASNWSHTPTAHLRWPRINRYKWSQCALWTLPRARGCTARVTRAANSCRVGGACPPSPASNEHCPEDRRRLDVVGALALVAPGVDTRNDHGCTCQRGRGCRALVRVGRAGLFRSSSMQTRVPRALDLTFMATRSSLCRTAAGLLRAWQHHYEGTETSLCVPARQVLAC